MSRIRHQHYDPALWERRELTAPELWAEFGHQEPPSVPVDTSEAAARKVEGKSAYWRAEIYALIKGCGALGATEREIEHALHLSGNTVRPRLWELEGNAPAGRPLRVALIRKTPQKRDGARVYLAL